MSPEEQTTPSRHEVGRILIADDEETLLRAFVRTLSSAGYEVVTAHDPDVIREVKGAAGADLLAPAEALLQKAGVDYELEVAGGEPAPMIVELAENYGCGLIVMGGASDVVDDVVAHSTLPVTVVPLPEDDA